MAYPRYKILIVDDEKPIRELLVSFLSSSGHQCETANTGKEA
ncbi:MAG: response regulator [Deltaproteobacteria bacterium]|nr:response regulator [Deltaproteobacteria bacterium]